jgi:hypothetical protein
MINLHKVYPSVSAYIEDFQLYVNELNDALVKISDYKLKPNAEGAFDYEGAFWDMVVIADSALYPEEYSRKDKEDGTKELDETSKDS